MIIKISGASSAAPKYFNISQVVARQKKNFLSLWICHLISHRTIGVTKPPFFSPSFEVLFRCQLKFLPFYATTFKAALKSFMTLFLSSRDRMMKVLLL
jgi:hypothetical protein